MKINQRQAEKQILDALMKEASKRISRNRPRVQRDLERVLQEWVYNSPAVVSLEAEVFGSLKATFGLTTELASQAARELSIAVGKCLSVIVSNTQKLISVEFNFVRNDFRDLLALSSASFVTEKGTRLDWLDWLLNAGDTVVVAGWHYKAAADGRSGLGIMKSGKAFRVPPEFSGTPVDNFIHKLFDGRDKELSVILGKLLS